ncbi:MAG: hypothetical protein HFE90_10480 [Firmicutes bacterium]|nr:hypothetical protein [Bacillota bacterium]
MGDLVPIPVNENISGKQIRDIEDHDFKSWLLTGDNDFLESDLKYPKIITPAGFLNIKIFRV